MSEMTGILYAVAILIPTLAAQWAGYHFIAYVVDRHPRREVLFYWLTLAWAMCCLALALSAYRALDGAPVETSKVRTP